MVMIRNIFVNTHKDKHIIKIGEEKDHEFERDREAYLGGLEEAYLGGLEGGKKGRSVINYNLKNIN